MNILQLTDKVTQKLIHVSAGQIKLLEDADGGGTHIVFGGDMGRVVVETKEQIFAVLGVVPVKPV